MSGEHSGVQARIKEQAKFAFYIHCSAPCLNSVLVDIVKDVPETEEFFSLLHSLYSFTSGSYVHPKLMSLQREKYGSTKELQRLSTTRWTCQFPALRNIVDTLPALKQLLQEVAQGWENCWGPMSSGSDWLWVCCASCYAVYVFWEDKAAVWHVTTIDLSRSADLVNAWVQTLKDYRLESFFITCGMKMKHWKFVSKVMLQHSQWQKLSSRLSGYCTLSTVGQREVECDKDMFRTSFFYPVIDSMLNEFLQYQLWAHEKHTVSQPPEWCLPKGEHCIFIWPCV